MTDSSESIPLWLTETVGKAAIRSGMNKLIPLSDGSLLILNTQPYKESRVFRIAPEGNKVSKLKLPIEEDSWVVPTRDGRILISQPSKSEILLWKVGEGEQKSFSGEVPTGDTICWDVYGDQLFIIVNQNVSGSAAGFDWSDDTTGFAIFNLKKNRFHKAFHSVEGTDARAIIMQDSKKFVVFGYGRTSHFFWLLDSKFQDLLKDERNWRRFHLSHSYSVHFVGSDEEHGVLMFGCKENKGERALMRWAMGYDEFETLATLDEPDLFLSCSAKLADGSFLFFLRERYTDQMFLFQYRKEQGLEKVGRLEMKFIDCAAQADDGRIYFVESNGNIYILNQP